MARRKKRELISQREYARRCGLSPSTVNEAIKRGRIELVEGKIDPILADRQWAENTDPSTPRNRITGNPKHRRPPGQPPLPMNLGRRDGGSESIGSAAGYSKARAAREVYKAQLAKLELEKRKGELVRTDDVRRVAFAWARKARDQVLGLPERVVDLIAAAEDRDEIMRILVEETERICEEMSTNGRV
jgi:DNA-binding Lrp family transcriptional regulator